jgi:hypothetical protein
MSGETSRGAVLLLRDNNRYGAAALVRQIVEIEYLLCLFALDGDEPAKWASSDLDSVKKQYRPAEMRKRCGDRFRLNEYAAHCQVGGHPRFAAGYVLPEHVRLGPLSDAVLFAAGWVDLAQHLVQVWRWVEEILLKYELLHVGLAKVSLDRAKELTILWLQEDRCAPLLTESEAILLTQAAQGDSVTR